MGSTASPLPMASGRNHPRVVRSYFAYPSRLPSRQYPLFREGWVPPSHLRGGYKGGEKEGGAKGVGSRSEVIMPAPVSRRVWTWVPQSQYECFRRLKAAAWHQPVHSCGCRWRRHAWQTFSGHSSAATMGVG